MQRVPVCGIISANEKLSVREIGRESAQSLKKEQKMQRRSFLKGLACACAAGPLLRSETLFGAECPQGALVRFGMVTDLHYADIPMGP